MKICVSAESTIDLPREILDEFEIKTVPFTITLGDKNGLDGVTTPEEIFDYVDRTGVLPKTSAVNVAQFDEYFRNLLKTDNVFTKWGPICLYYYAGRRVPSMFFDNLR